MGAGHAHPLYVHGHSRVHQLAPEVKVAGAVAFVFAVAVTPREAVWAFAVHAAVLAGTIACSGVRGRFIASRLTVIVPFVAFALFIPFVATGERIRHVINGQLVADWSDPKPELCETGPIGLQLHSNTVPQELHFRGLILTVDPEDKLVTVEKE